VHVQNTMVSYESSDTELITYCLSGPHDRIIGGTLEGNLVARVSEQAVIKFGPGLSKDEAVNRQRAYNLVNHNIVRVPRVHRFFTDNMGRGYTVMGYMEGRVINPLVEPDRIKKPARVLDYFCLLKRDIHGSPSGGPCRGLL
jgi:hypothetical protein